ncbi:hypothetical protein EDC14_101980 [Hydrogenispora ethanolica]|jgi:hypothetical protein|uniref:Uncharacterized protein n=1 Tax=Hydrogenispora ethanolica TaxID=1082276 RepID=A0A4R1RED2_HYDET|nr:hypothetical protein [Hydrogenispora ethanolica]TCL64274.1 hypothetical protein EDC14_101980 [Hydrogenispora ethanolica]
MKHFIRMMAIFLWLTVMLAAGYGVLFVNLSRLLGTGPSDFGWQWTKDRLIVTAGDLREEIRLGLPLQIVQLRNGWRIQSPQGALRVSTQPRLEISWENSLKRRSSKMNGEY